MSSDPVSEHITGGRNPSLNPPLSHLYNLEPIGIGTPATESLTSYLTRLAGIHNVFTGTLISQELAPLLNKMYLTSGGLPNVSREGAINGSGTMATEWVEVLKRLTLRQDLHYLTLLTWKAILTRQGVLRSTKAWCPICFEEWYAAGKEVYEPLLWTLQVITICPHHRCPLQQRCHHAGCYRVLPWLGIHAQLGYCNYCHGWLGITPESALLRDEQVEKEILVQQTWIWKHVGELIAFAPQVDSPPVEHSIARGLEYYIEQVAQGNNNVFAQRFGFHRKSVMQWRNKYGVPSLALFLRLCYQLDISPRSFVYDQQNRSAPKLRSIQSQDSWRQPRKPARKQLMRSTLQGLLEAIISANLDPPPSVEEVARQLGYRSARPIYKRFPGLGQSITSRYQIYQHKEGERRIGSLCEQVRHVTFELHAKGVYPSRYRIEESGMKGGYFLHPAVQSAWHKARQELGVE